MHVNLPSNTDIAAFAEWCESFKIDAKLIVVRSGGEIIGYTARTDDPDAVVEIEMRWGVVKNTRPIKDTKLKRLRPFKEHLLRRE